MNSSTGQERRQSPLQSLSLLIDIAVNRSRTIDAGAACAFLEHHAIAEPLIARVLGEPSRRRATAWERCTNESALRQALGVQPLITERRSQQVQCE